MDARTTPRRLAHVVGLLGAACGASVALAAPVVERPPDDEHDSERTVLAGRATLDGGTLAEGGWSILTDQPDLFVAGAGPALVRVVVDAGAGPTTAGSRAAGALVAELSSIPGLIPVGSASRPGGVQTVFATDPAALSGHELVCSTTPVAGTHPVGTTLTGAGDAKVVAGTPCVTERVYVLDRGAGNLLVEVQAPKVVDGAPTAFDLTDDLVATLVPVGTAIDDHLTTLFHATL